MVRVTEFNVATRPIRRVILNNDGDLGFATSVDTKIVVWRLPDLTILGDYKDHVGDVSNAVLTRDSTRLMSIGADGYNNIYCVETGKKLFTEQYGKVTSGGIAADNSFFITATTQLSVEVLIIFASVDNPVQVKSIEVTCKARIIGGHWINKDTSILLYYSDGSIQIYDTKTGTFNKFPHVHSQAINDVYVSNDGLMLATGSSDQTVKLWNVHNDSTITHFETFNYFRSIFTCALSPTHPHIAAAGGTEKVEVTTTHGSQVYTEARFTNCFTKKEFANIPGHLGTINSLRYMLDGSGFMSGGENGTVRFYNFDDAFFDADLCLA